MNKNEQKIKNKNLQQAKSAKNDEFYTQLSDIEKELKNYKNHFEDKIVFCNCDDPEWSNFYKFFKQNFFNYKLKKLITTHFDSHKPTYKLIYDGTKEEVEKIDLMQNGDFRSTECLSLLEEADIVVTNPPFSLLREFIAKMEEYNKKFLIIGNKNAITYKEIFPLLKDNKIWLGFTNPKEFKKPDGTIQKFGNIGWFTNLDIQKRHEDIILFKKYSPKEYPEYDNYKAINVNKVNEIPCDYDGVMGVPITFLDNYNPEQFEIIGQTGVDIPITKGRPYVDGKRMYARVLIKKKGKNNED